MTMTIPREYVIKESDAQLGTTNSLGFVKSVFGEKRIPPGKISKHHEFIALINNFKPISITDIKHLIQKIKTESKLVEYIKTIKVYYIIVPLDKESRNKFNIGVVWINSKYEKKAMLLRLFHYWSHHPKYIIKDFVKERNKLYDSLDLSLDIKRFMFHYITGTLLGYRPSSIRGYYLSGPIINYLNKMNGYDTLEKKNLFRALDVKIRKEKLMEARDKYIQTPEYQVFLKEYPILKKKCDKWIEYMINKSEMFNMYYNKYKKKIKLLPI
jgi:hypothetical protein